MKVESRVNSGFLIRSEIKNSDVENVKKIVASTGFFTEDEIIIAAELIDEALKRGKSSGYHFIFLEMDNETVGYACFGPIPATEFSYDLYWIAVHKEYQNMGLGRILIAETEKAINNLGGNRIYI